MRSYCICFLAIGLMFGCIDPFEPDMLTFESVMVVEAVLTDEDKIQQVQISTTYAFKDEKATAETGALVQVTTDKGNVYEFEETLAGQYDSKVSFKILPGTKYMLTITRKNGEIFESSAEQLQSPAIISRLSVGRNKAQNMKDGITVYADAIANSEEPAYFRYEFEETYKVIAPRWTPMDFTIVNTQEATGLVYDSNGTESVVLAPKQQEERVCYATRLSNDIILADTRLLGENRRINVKVHFVDKKDYALSHRYSILVRQMVISPRAYTYYTTLKNTAVSESVFYENQPGFVVGNISSADDKDKKVIGFFSVASVVEARIFFSYTDFYPDEPLPAFVNNCNLIFALNLIESVRIDNVHYDPNGYIDIPAEVIYVMPRECGDCTALGTNVKPDFWID